ncbi:hypothetical protein FHG66_04155 [Rubellimicrobium rubrum]|uniref:Methyl-accepting chemotaxis protein n=1 Tax=Rubellimicrobium rubrum TaxID=2585369 RepID=A0A5C4N0E7_9RHOB|nr:hypothetical protein [Rubellimicrobium rubrum]TNC52003.1 hypothetical protein FHG66_04155 [Rubellimicrobium rubrum]
MLDRSSDIDPARQEASEVTALDWSPLTRVAVVRSRTEAVFGASLDAMLGAVDDLSLTESSLAALADALSPATMVRLKSLQPRFQDLSRQVEAKADRCRVAAGALGGLMRDARSRLEELRRLARTATLVSLNALVVSRTLNSDGGTIDGLARDMRAVLGEVGGLVADLAVRISAGQSELNGVAEQTAKLQTLAHKDVLPAIRTLSELIQAKSRDDRIARSAGLVSKRFRALQDRVSQVILHLQVGDGFRQRLEHIEAILAMAQDPDNASIRTMLHRLGAAQLRGALIDLRSSLQVAGRHIRAMSRMGAEIPRAGAISAIRGGQDGLGVLLSAASGMETVIERLSDRSGRLTVTSRGLAATLAGAGQNADQAAEFERRMTVLGLNAILLASRLGSEGRAMEEVAQQQRDIARSIIEVMGLLRKELEAVVVTSGALDAPEDETLTGTLHAAAEAALEISILSGRVRGHLAAMDSVRGSDEIAVVVERAGRELDHFMDMAKGLDEVARVLDQGHVAAEAPPGHSETFARVRTLYSMQSERDIHDRMFPRDAAAEIAAEPEEEDDFLFA